MTIEARVIEDSVSLEGIRLTTFELYYPRIIHSEFMTHRVLSRNASSSRAVPSWRAIAAVLGDPAEPVSFGRNQPGMQAGAELDGWRRGVVRAAWHGAKWAACAAAYIAHKAGAHKQVVNRIIEPWSHIKVVVTATDWANFFALRDHEDADPTIRVLAEKMKVAMDESNPKLLRPGEWHLPYILPTDRIRLGNDIEKLKKTSAARCARTSYLLHNGQDTEWSADLKLYQTLVISRPVHASPTEHQATPDKRWSRGRWAKPQLHGNLRGYVQFRKTIEGEAVYEQ